MAPTVESVVLWVHIGFGFVALGGGAGAVLTAKGGPAHRRFGRAFVAAMTVVAATALALYPFDPSPARLFLALVALFSYYFVFSGYRALGRKRPADGAGAPDWVAVAVLAAAGVGLLAHGVVLAADGAAFAPVLLVFGGIATAVSALDVRAYRRPDAIDRHWALVHLSRMGAGYIAAVTAFATVNLTAVPTLARWLGPTVLGTVAIALGVRTYRARYDPAAESAD